MSEELQKLFRYNCTLDRVIDGDTVDLNIDLGFSVFLTKQRVRLAGIDTPESRTRNQIEKKLGSCMNLGARMKVRCLYNS